MALRTFAYMPVFLSCPLTDFAKGVPYTGDFETEKDKKIQKNVKKVLDKGCKWMIYECKGI